MNTLPAPYCVATYIRDYDLQSEEVATLGSFDEVLSHLQTIQCWFADRMADMRAEDEASDDVVGGLGVRLENRWGGKVEVGVGSDIWSLMRHQPTPSKCYSDRPQLAGLFGILVGRLAPY